MKNKDERIWQPGTVNLYGPDGSHQGEYDVWGKSFSEVLAVTFDTHEKPINRKVDHRFEWQRSTVNGLKGKRVITYPDKSYRFYEGIAEVTPPDIERTEFDSNIYNDALSKLNAKVRGEVDISVDSFQAKQTYKMLYDANKLVQKIISVDRKQLLGFFFNYQKLSTREVRKINLRVKRRQPSENVDLSRMYAQNSRAYMKAVGQKWLEWQYGWKPLASTFYDSCEKLMSSPKPEISVQVTKRGNHESRRVVNVALLGDCNLETTVKEFCRFTARFKHPASDIAILAQFTSLDPLAIAWELTPYSFIVDWFFDVGSYLRNLESRRIYSDLFLGGRYTQSLVVVEKGSISDSFTSDGITTSSSYEHTSRYTSLKRVPLTSYPSPIMPSFTLDIGGTRLLNTAALLTTFFKSRGK